MTEQGQDKDLARGKGMALWRQIAERLESDIVAGRHRPGERLPTEHRMAETFAVNRHTVRRAVASLEEAGLVRIEQGRGTFVQESVVDYRVKQRTRFSENLLNASRSRRAGCWPCARSEPMRRWPRRWSCERGARSG